jgi:Resolvase, N terminal domain
LDYPSRHRLRSRGARGYHRAIYLRRRIGAPLILFSPIEPKRLQARRYWATVLEIRRIEAGLAERLRTDVDPFMLHIHAAVAEKERSLIARRTREALAAAKARGVKLGDPEIGERKRVAADAYAETLRDAVAPLARAGLTTRAIAAELNDRGLKPFRGGAWQAPQIMRLLARLELR